MKLTDKEEKFVQGLFSGLSQRLAYKEAYPNSLKWTDNTTDVRACKLAKTDKIVIRLTELRSEVASKNILTEIELQEFWSRIIKDGSIKYETKDRLRASELLGKNKKMFVDKVEHSGEIKMPDIIIKK